MLRIYPITFETLRELWPFIERIERRRGVRVHRRIVGTLVKLV